MSTTTRRGFALAASAAALAPGAARAAGGLLPLPLGVQLWTVKAELDREFDGTLKRLHALGYGRVEAAGLHGRTPAAFRAAVERAGLKLDSAHHTQAELEADLPGVLAEARTLGLRWLTCSSPTPSRPLAAIRPGEDWMDQMRRAMTLDDWRRTAAALNRAGAAAAAQGLQLTYHTHAFEFARYEGVVGFEELIRLSDPRLVEVELDIGWVVAGGRDPVATLRGLRGRTPLIHIKDLKARPTPGVPDDYTTVAIGRGVIDWPAVFAAARAAGVQGGYVEQEAPFMRPVFDSLADSARHLAGLRA